MDKLDGEALQMLLASDEPSLRYHTRTELLGHDPAESELVQLQEQIPSSERVKALLSERDGAGRLPWHPYDKWYGAHWVLADLAALAYPPGDRDLIPLRGQVLNWLLGERHLARIKNIAGKTRRCASQEGNALWYLLRLGLADERCETLARSLVAWQWPDGGWNCDKNPAAQCSSFMETLLPMRGLALFGELTGATWASTAAREAAEVFLRRRLFRRRRDGEVIREEFLKLHFPCYWHYDILSALKVLAEMDLLEDVRCQEALALLNAKRLPHGGWPAEAKYWEVIPANAERQNNTSLVGWGPTGARRCNPWVTLEALMVLSATPKS
jgi:hypothetical protein